jgi:hypothetical protein
MTVARWFGTTLSFLVVGLVAASACDEAAPGCQVDVDCAAGLLCRQGSCIAIGDAAVVDAPSVACLDENAACAPPTTPPPDIDAAPPVTCVGQYQICLIDSDCCPGFRCPAGTCL